MKDQFGYYSKDESGWQRFVPDSAEKKKEITPEIERWSGKTGTPTSKPVDPGPSTLIC
jgi:hypothetical protein